MLKRFWNDFETFLEHFAKFWKHFENILRTFLEHFWIIFNTFCNDLMKIWRLLEPILVQFKISAHRDASPLRIVLSGHNVVGWGNCRRNFLIRIIRHDPRITVALVVAVRVRAQNT